MSHIDGCQIPGYTRIAEGEIDAGVQSPIRRFKGLLAKPWNYRVKPQLKRMVKALYAWRKRLRVNGEPIPVTATQPSPVSLKAGDLVRVRDRAQIEATLDPFKELKGCAFLEYMLIYCGSVQRVLQPVERFLDERDYKVKRARGVVLLEGVLCHGTPVFGKCDRACHLFWREEWLEKLESIAE